MTRSKTATRASFLVSTAAVVLFACLVVLALPGAAQAHVVERVSVGALGEGDDWSEVVSLSADGRYAAFYAKATNLVANDTNGVVDIFVYDRQAAVMTRVSVSSTGVQSNGESRGASISADGRYVAFYSHANNLVANDDNGNADIFVHDRNTGQTTRVSVSSAGVQADDASHDPSISGDGRYVAFHSYATNLVANDDNDFRDIFVHDRTTGQTTRVSVSSAEAEGDGDSLTASVSADGNFVAFQSAATNLVAGDSNAVVDVFVRDLTAGTTERVSVNSAEVQGNGTSESASISADGGFVAFQSSADNLVSGDTVTGDVFVRDRAAGTTERVSVSSAGNPGSGSSATASISADGRYVAFLSYAADLVTGDSNGAADSFVHDRNTGDTIRVSVTMAGVQGNGDSLSRSISADGRFVSFTSFATNLVPGDTNGQQDVFVARNAYLLAYYGSTGGGFTGTSPQMVPHGGSGTLVTAVPNTGYHFVSWSDGVLTAARTDTNVMADLSATATFAIDTFTLTYTAGANGTISGTSPQTVDYGASGTQVTAVPNTGYHFVSWSDGVLTAARTDANVMADLSVTANFALNTYTLTYTPGANGTITGTSPQTVDHGASGTLVTAVPSTGYHFVSWSDGVLTAARTDTNVTGDITVTANFASNTFTLTYTAGANGTITGASPQTVDYGASGTQVTAVPNTGYHFVSWSDGVLTAARTDTNVMADISVTATFASNATIYTSIRGTHRYHTAQLISQAMFASALPAGAGVVVAPGETFQEALCGAPLAAAYGGPVLLTPTVGLENGTKAELQRLAPTYVFCIGLSDAVVDAVEAALPAATVTPINGTLGNVYDMSYRVAKALGAKVGDMTGATAIVTIGTNFPDAIGVSPLACAELWPILLTEYGDNRPLNGSAALAVSELGITKAIKAGTYATLPGTLTGLANLSGTDRYVTDANVADWAETNAGLSFMHTGLATGDKFPDALASGPYLAKDNGILLLSPLTGPLPPVIGALITANAASVYHVTFIAMIEPVISQVKALLP